METKVNFILALVAIQTVILFFMFVSSIMPSPATLIAMIVLVIIAVFLLNSYLPGWAGYVSRFVISIFSGDKKAATKMRSESVNEEF